MSQSQVQEVFGKYAVEIDGSVQLFETHAEASSKAILAARSAEFEARANKYVEALGLNADGKEKAAAGKRNQIIAFLAFEASQEDEDASDPA